MKPIYSVIIPVYKNTDMVIRNLSHNMPYFEGCEVIVVDDASGNGLADTVREKFPNVHVYENSHNLGFGPTVNNGVSHAHGEYLILLGSDVRLMKPFSPSLIKRFQDDSHLFALSFRQRERDGSSMGKNTIYFRKGMPGHNKTEDDTPGKNAWADGGSSIVRASMYRELGGFCDIYAPFYWEDVDLSFRAMKRGWHVDFEPNLYVEHHHESTIGSLFTKDHVRMISYRNQFLFTWSALDVYPYVVLHLVRLPWYLVRMGRRDVQFVNGFFRACARIPQVIHARSKLKHKVSDREIFSQFTS